MNRSVSAPNPSSRHRLLAVGLVVLAIAGCRSAATPSPSASTPALGASPSSAASPSSGASAAASGSAPSASTTGAVPNAMLLLARAGEDRWRLIDAASGTDLVTNDEFTLPVGAPHEGWSRIVSATIQGDQTIVRDDVVQPGFGGPSLKLNGHWRLPTIGDDPVPIGRSLDGSTIVLVEAEPTKAGSSRFAIVEHRFDGQVSTVGDADLALARIVELRGSFEYDTMSPNGRILYVVEHLDASAGGRYQVRSIDVPTGVMREAVIVDKANPDERMAGYPIAQVRHPSGVVFTLYDGPEHPFIHALQSVEAWAFCLDLPPIPMGTSTGWGLAASPSGASVFAVNAPAGVAVDVNPAELSIRRTALLGSTAAASPFVLAKFGHSDVGPVGRGLVATPDGRQLLAASTDGVVVLAAGDLSIVRRDLGGTSISAIGLTPDGSLGFALAAGGRLIAFDPATGQAFGDVKGGPWSQLLAVAPW